ncbi:MAG TPA: hypothetical protein PLV25_05185 [Opitutales bacterium]|nr:hypothetical protein [Opitutales bacterium]
MSPYAFGDPGSIHDITAISPLRLPESLLPDLSTDEPEELSSFTFADFSYSPQAQSSPSPTISPIDSRSQTASIPTQPPGSEFITYIKKADESGKQAGYKAAIRSTPQKVPTPEELAKKYLVLINRMRNKGQLPVSLSQKDINDLCKAYAKAYKKQYLKTTAIKAAKAPQNKFV